MRPNPIQYRLAAVATPLLLVAAAHAGGASGTAFTYQGQLKQDGVPVSETCDFEFRLFDFDSTPPGIQVGPTLTFDGGAGNAPPIAVVNGLFQVELDLGADAFNGDARWLQVDVCCSSPCTPAFSTLVPRQLITATPYALKTRGIFVDADHNVGIGTDEPTWPLQVETTSDFAIFGITSSPGGTGVRGDAIAPSGTNFGVWGRSNSNSSRGVFG